MIGVSTDFRLVTRLIDLRTGKAQLTIDNSANYRENILTYTSMDFPAPCCPWLVIVGGIVALAVLGLLIVLKYKSIKSPPA